MDEATELEQYLFDLQGYLVLENVLDPYRVAELNALIDEQQLPPPPAYARFGSAGGQAASGPGFLEWGQPFCDLMDHPRVMEVLRMRLGDCFRLDRLFGMYMRKGMESMMLHSDYGASERFTRAERGRYFLQPEYQALNGFFVAAWNLTDTGPSYGGLRCIPGSHKSHYKLPRAIRKEEFQSVVRIPEAPAGSVTLFSEALTHGTGAWTADHERRTLLYKYCASNLTWSTTRVTPPSSIKLTDRQTQLLEPPGGGQWFFGTLFPESAETG